MKVIVKNISKFGFWMAAVIMIVNGNLGTSVAVLGAFGLIRVGCVRSLGLYRDRVVRRVVANAGGHAEHDRDAKEATD